MRREFRFTDEDFAWLQRFIAEQSGISLSDSKRYMIYNRLAKRLRWLGVKDFASYIEILQNGDADEAEQFINAVTTNLTRFFREPHHFALLKAEYIKLKNDEKRVGRNIRIWSAACSTGEEPYSIAMTLLNTEAGASDDFTIFASDIDSATLARAQVGIYSDAAVKSLSSTELRRWFLRGRSDNRGMVKIRPEIKTRVTFSQLNLIGKWPKEISKLDFVFCRNVAIYFDKATQKVLFERIAEAMNVGGIVFIGHSESLYGVSSRFQLLGQTTYRKVA